MTPMTPMTPMTLPYDIDDPALARATWSRLAEPDNATAAMVVGRIGPSPALRWLLEEAIDPSGQVGVRAGAAVALPGHEGVAAVHGLHVHRLPYGPALGVDGRDGLEDLLGAAPAGLGAVEIVALAAHLGAHGLGVHDEAGEPEVGLGLPRVVGVHRDR